MRSRVHALGTLTTLVLFVYAPVSGCGGGGGSGADSSDAAATTDATSDVAMSLDGPGAAETSSPSEASLTEAGADAATTLDASASGDTSLTDADAATTLACVAGSRGPSGAALWADGFTDSINGSLLAPVTAVDSAGNTFVFGTFTGTLTLGAKSVVGVGPFDLFLAKVDATGTVLWVHGYGSYSFANGVAVDASGNVYVSGRFESDLDFGGGTDAGNYGNSYAKTNGFLAKFDGDGNYVWSQEVGNGSGNEILTGIVVDGLGGVAVVGGLQGSVTFAASDGGTQTVTSAGSNDILVLKVSEGGVFQWAARFGDGSDQEASSISADAAGNFYVGAYGSGTLDLGAAGTLSATSYDNFLLKLAPSGAPSWGRALTGNGDIGGEYVATTPGGTTAFAFTATSAVSLSGSDAGDASLPFGGNGDVVVTAFDTDGNYLWGHDYGDSLDQEVQAVAVDLDGNVFLTGGFEGTLAFQASGPGTWVSQGGYDAFLLELNAGGDYVRSEAPGGVGDQWGYGLAVSGCTPIIAGTYAGTFSFPSLADGGSASMSFSGGDALFVAALAP